VGLASIKKTIDTKGILFFFIVICWAAFLLQQSMDIWELVSRSLVGNILLTVFLLLSIYKIAVERNEDSQFILFFSLGKKRNIDPNLLNISKISSVFILFSLPVINLNYLSGPNSYTYADLFGIFLCFISIFTVAFGKNYFPLLTNKLFAFGLLYMGLVILTINSIAALWGLSGPTIITFIYFYNSFNSNRQK
tara:strand:+ start:70400 stop:70978 length:579 start_codon:yes stop_codon:yes gene_type:complete